MATNELTKKLQRRMYLNEEVDDCENKIPKPTEKIENIYTKFPDFSRKELNNFKRAFTRSDQDNDNFLNFNELKVLMESLQLPQTHLALKELMKEIDQDKDNLISLVEFINIFQKVRSGQVDDDSAIMNIYDCLSSIDVDETGVKGAKGFFESKIDSQTNFNKAEEEIKKEQEEKRALLQEKAESRKKFQEKANMFKN